MSAAAPETVKVSEQRQALARGDPVEVFRVRVVTLDGSLWTCVNNSHAGLRADLEAYGDLLACLLERYKGTDRHLFDVVVYARLDDAGWTVWSTAPSVAEEDILADDGYLLRVADAFAVSVRGIVERRFTGVTV